MLDSIKPHLQILIHHLSFLDLPVFSLQLFFIVRLKLTHKLILDLLLLSKHLNSEILQLVSHLSHLQSKPRCKSKVLLLPPLRIKVFLPQLGHFLLRAYPVLSLAGGHGHVRRGSASAEPEWGFVALDRVTESSDHDLWFALGSFVGVPGEGVVVAGAGEFSAFFEVSVGLFEFFDFFLE